MIKATYFSEGEFKKCTPSCSLQDMNQEFMNKLDELRELLGIPLVLTCAYRSASYDLSKGRSGNSAHTRGLAVDIYCTNGAVKMKIIDAARTLGFTRFGVGKTFVHLDMDFTLPQNVIWGY